MYRILGLGGSLLCLNVKGWNRGFVLVDNVLVVKLVIRRGGGDVVFRVVVPRLTAETDVFWRRLSRRTLVLGLEQP